MKGYHNVATSEIPQKLFFFFLKEFVRIRGTFFGISFLTTVLWSLSATFYNNELKILYYCDRKASGMAINFTLALLYALHYSKVIAH